VTTSQSDKAARFLELHRPGQPLVMPNPWDPGSARILTAAGFEALATTSSGSAGALGKVDGALRRDEVVRLAAAIVEATELPVSADYEHAFGDDLDALADSVRAIIGAGVAGFSIEDYDAGKPEPILPAALAAERVAAVTEIAHGGGMHIVVTARAENHIRGRDDLDDTIARLQSYAAAGADALFAPGLIRIEDIRRVVSEVDRPVNVLMFPGGPTLAELADAGVARVSIGGSLWYVAMGALATAAADLRAGTVSYGDLLKAGRQAVKGASFETA
jgi:2-methylisocitrate lyase-like PEP mutase family enzyme